MSLAGVAALIADPARAAMLQALMAGQAMTAGELAGAAGVAPSSASAHIAKLQGGGLVRVTPQGRHRYVSLAGEPVAAMLETLLTMTAPPGRTWPHGPALRRARTCFTHLAGELGVGLRGALVSRGWVAPRAGGWQATEAGALALAAVGVVPRAAACDCMDWSERVPHLSGPLAVAICRHALDRGWLRRSGAEGLARRALLPTPEGARMLRAVFGVTLG